jgi:DNA-binding PadR family transcriptional regulator
MAAASAKDLFVLGRISLRPTYGHEIMRTLRESHADLWIDLSEKHVYYILKKLAAENLVVATDDDSGGLPRRKVYAITGAGIAALAQMMTAESLAQAMPYSEFDVLLGMVSYTDALDDAAKDAVLRRRRDSLEATLERLAQASAGAPASAEVGGFPAIILARVTQRLADELDWLDEVASEVERAGWDSMKPAFKPADETT